ncbi:MAG: winged helix-turn-helix domain-containing protein [Gluconacetobacter sp.]
MTAFLPSLDRGAGDNLQEQIVRQFITAITEGGLRPGQRLPSVRESAVRWCVSRNTVVLAYERLEAEGYVEARSSSGTFVHRMPPGARRAITTPTPGLGAGESRGPPPPLGGRPPTRGPHAHAPSKGGDLLHPVDDAARQ